MNLNDEQLKAEKPPPLGRFRRRAERARAGAPQCLAGRTGTAGRGPRRRASAATRHVELGRLGRHGRHAGAGDADRHAAGTAGRRRHGPCRHRRQSPGRWTSSSPAPRPARWPCRSASRPGTAAIAAASRRRRRPAWPAASLAAPGRLQQVVAVAAPPSGGMRQAASSLPAAVLAAVDASMAGEALNAEQERVARDTGWAR